MISDSLTFTLLFLPHIVALVVVVAVLVWRRDVRLPEPTLRVLPIAPASENVPDEVEETPQ